MVLHRFLCNTQSLTDLAVRKPIANEVKDAPLRGREIHGGIVVVGTAAQLLFFNVLGGATGMLVFPFAALALALADREREARA